jgi:hypothetical protein
VAAIGERLEAGGSAIFVLGDERAGTGWTAREVARFGGTVYSADLPPDRLARFQAMLDQAGPGVGPPRRRPRLCPRTGGVIDATRSGRAGSMT